jgi:hypothetical protein
MRGQYVVCKDFRFEPLLRRVWLITPEKIFIHDDENYDRHLRGLPCLEPVGFPVEDVYAYESGTVTSEWNLMVPFRAEQYIMESK